MKLVAVETSNRIDKKFVAVFQKDDGKEKRVSFGAKGMQDYTITHDKAQRDRYWTRHEKDLKTEDPTRPGHLSLFILWGPHTSLRDNVHEYKKRFDL